MGPAGPLVAGKGAQSRIALGHAAAQAGGERRDDSGLDVTNAGDPRQRSEQNGGTRQTGISHRGGAIDVHTPFGSEL